MQVAYTVVSIYTYTGVYVLLAAASRLQARLAPSNTPTHSGHSCVCGLYRMDGQRVCRKSCFSIHTKVEGLMRWSGGTATAEECGVLTGEISVPVSESCSNISGEVRQCFTVQLRFNAVA